MSALKICALLVTGVLLECTDAHGHSETEFDKITVVAQKYPSLADVDIEPSFLAAHRRKLAVKNQAVEVEICQTCTPNGGDPLTCDDLVCFLWVAATVVI